MLARAIGRNDVKAVEALLQGGADANEQDGDGYSMLRLAAILGCTAIARVLIENGADVNGVDAHDDMMGSTPLMSAVSMNSLAIARLLLDSGANINAVNVRGWTALMYAVVTNRMEIMSLLIDRGADAGLRNRDGATAQKLAEVRNRKEMAQLLKEAPSQQSHAVAAKKQKRLKNISIKPIIRKHQP